MIINNLTINNFQSYFGNQSLDFSEGLNLIIGSGGKGKSKLFNAFYWVLFGKLYITDIGWCDTDELPQSAKGAMNGHEFINKRALFLAEIGDEVKTKVEIELRDDKARVYIIERSAISIKKAEAYEDSNSWENFKSNIQVRYDDIQGTKIEQGERALFIINKLFPEGIRNYIWFQGETLDNLINFRNKETLKEAVKHISYYPYYERMSDIIEQSSSRIKNLELRKIREANKNNKEIDSLASTIENNNYQIEKLSKEKKDLELGINQIKIALLEDETKIKGLASHTKLVSEYHKLENKISDVLKELTIQDEYQRNQIPKLWILNGIDTMIQESNDIIFNYTNEQNTVPEKKYLDNPGRVKLKEILRDEKCFVCGSNVKEDSDSYKWIQKRLEEQDKYLKEMEEFKINWATSKKFERFIGSIQDYPNEVGISLTLINKQFKTSENEIEKLQNELKRLQNRRKKLDEEIQNIKKRHGINPIKQAGEIGRINYDIDASRTNLERQERAKDTIEIKLGEAKKELKNTHNRLSKLTSKSTTSSVPETEWNQISDFLKNVCNKVQICAREELLTKIEKRANEFYQKFTEHDIGYKGEVKIDKNYEINYDVGLNTSHEDRKKMSIINAMLSLNQEALDIYYPFISDAPTSSFDAITTKNYLLGIKDIFKQSIIMTKDVEKDSEDYYMLYNQPKISKIYILESARYCKENEDPLIHEVSTKTNNVK